MMNQIVIKRRAPITAEERQGIARAYRGGKTFEEIETMFSVSGTSIKRILDENKIPYPKKRWMWTDEEKKKVERYHSLGWNVDMIAKQLGRNKSSVNAYIHNRMNSEVNSSERHPKSWTTSEAMKCKELFEQGMRAVDIAKELGRTEGSVSGWISDNLKDTVHARARAARRLDGTPMPETKKEETPVKPSLAEQIENAKNKMAEDAGFEIVESHTKVIKHMGVVYTIDMVNGTINFDLEDVGRDLDKEHFGMFINDLAKIHALM